MKEGSVPVPFGNPFFLAPLPIIFRKFILNSSIFPAQSIFKPIVIVTRRKSLKIGQLKFNILELVSQGILVTLRPFDEIVTKLPGSFMKGKMMIPAPNVLTNILKIILKQPPILKFEMLFSMRRIRKRDGKNRNMISKYKRKMINVGIWNTFTPSCISKTPI